MTDRPASPTPIDDDAAEHLVAAYDDAVEPAPEKKAAHTMSNESLLSAYERTAGAAGDPAADAPPTESKKRNLDL